MLDLSVLVVLRAPLPVLGVPSLCVAPLGSDASLPHPPRRRRGLELLATGSGQVAEKEKLDASKSVRCEAKGICTGGATPVGAVRRGCESHKVRHVLAPAPPKDARGVGVKPPARRRKGTARVVRRYHQRFE